MVELTATSMVNYLRRAISASPLIVHSASVFDEEVTVINIDTLPHRDNFLILDLDNGMSVTLAIDVYSTPKF